MHTSAHSRRAKLQTAPLLALRGVPMSEGKGSHTPFRFSGGRGFCFYQRDRSSIAGEPGRPSFAEAGREGPSSSLPRAEPREGVSRGGDRETMPYDPTDKTLLSD